MKTQLHSGWKDEVLEERMSEDGSDWRIRDWLSRSVQPQDSISVCDEVVEENPEEPMYVLTMVDLINMRMRKCGEMQAIS